VMRCLAAKKRVAGCITTGKRKRFFLMGNVDRWLLVVGAVLRAGLLMFSASAQAGGTGEPVHARFAIKQLNADGDMKAQLWGLVSVARLAPDLSITSEDSASGYSRKIGIVSTVFWVGEIGGSPLTPAARGTRIGSRVTGAWMIRRGERGLSRLDSGRWRILSTWHCHTVICRQGS
jgi:hypothetical protein